MYFLKTYENDIFSHYINVNHVSELTIKVEHIEDGDVFYIECVTYNSQGCFCYRISEYYNVLKHASAKLEDLIKNIIRNNDGFYKI